MRDIQKELFELGDKKYKEFHSRLIPEVKPDAIIGVRTPVLRKYARELAEDPQSRQFMNSLPHIYYDENNLHGFLIERIKDFDTAVYETERFLPYIDNWATCDMLLPPVFKKNRKLLLPKIREWIKSDSVYTVRYAIGLLLSLYLDDEFTPELAALAASVKSEEYYINMMIAWYFATALFKQYEIAVTYLTEHRLSAWVHNKAIQKAVESRRIPDETKAYLKTLKISS
ncbi:MAG: DNA alkylation repair protein [Clostridia bacterium]|nr:DNA alkylation repair protein [Clostridia bacterium]